MLSHGACVCHQSLLEEVSVDMVVTVTKERMVDRMVYVADPSVRVARRKG